MLLPYVLVIAGSSMPTSSLDLFGAAVTSIEDVDGWGQPDLAVGDPAGYDRTRPSRVWIVSMETGQQLRSIETMQASTGFGWTLAAVGDVDGEGHGDLAIGDNGWGSASAASRVTLVSCADGRVLCEWTAEARGLWDVWHSFGADPKVCGVGDWNGDGCADVAVGSPRHADCRGRVDVYSGCDGATLQSFVGEAGTNGFGVSLAALQDQDGDAQYELAVGVVGGGDNACTAGRGDGRVRIFSSRNGALLAELKPDPPSPCFGLSLANAGDFDGDGRADLWIGEPLANTVQESRATPGLQIWSSNSWRPVFCVEGSPCKDGYTDCLWGAVLVAIDDVDGDRIPDGLASIPGAFGGDVSVISATGRILRRFAVNPGGSDVSFVGISACTVGDLDGDHSREVAVSGTTYRGLVTGMVAVVSPKKGTTLRRLTRESIGASMPEPRASR